MNRCRLLNHDGVMKGGQLIFSFFGTYDTSARSLVNPKIDEFSSCFLAGVNSCGICLLFCFNVPTSVNFLFFSRFPRSTDVKKLSVVTFRSPLS